MLDIGWTELLVIAVVMIVVVGPKDLPPMLRAFGKIMRKLTGMASDFRHQFDDALREADLDDVRKTIHDAQRLNPANSLRDAMNPLRQMGNELKADLQRSTSSSVRTPETPSPTGDIEQAKPELVRQPKAIVPKPWVMKKQPGPDEDKA